MIIVGANHVAKPGARKVYGWEDNGLFMLSPVAETQNNRRPVNRYDTREELDAVVQMRGLDLVWLTN